MVPGEGSEGAAGRVLGVDPHLDGVAVAPDVVLAEAERLTRRHPQLPLDQIEPGHQLGDRVLDLESGVHLEEEELAVLVEELDRPGVDVAAGLGHLDRGLAHGPADLVGEVRGRALLHQLLVASLGRAVPLAQPQRGAVGVGDDLHLDVARPGQVPLDVALVPAEVGQRLPHGRLEGLGGLVGTVHHLHAPPATAEGGLDGHRPPELVAEGDHLVRRGRGPRTARAPPTRRPARRRAAS